MIKGSIKCYKTDNSFKGGKIEVVLKSKYDELQQRIDEAIEYILKEYDTYNKGIFIVDQYDQPIYIDEIYGALLDILKGSDK